MGSRRLGIFVLAGALLVVAVVAVVASDDRRRDDRTADSDSAVVTRVIDGDTVEIASGEHVRLIGVDTPERGACGFDNASETLRRLVEGREVSLVNPESVQDVDAYDRLLRYVDVEDADAGLAQLRSGNARARYDSLDGYDPHPRQDRYHSADRRHQDRC